MEIFLTQLEQVVVPVSRCPLGAEHAAPASIFIQGYQQGNIILLGRANHELLHLPLFKLWHNGAHTPAAEVKREFITELAIVIRDASDGLHHIAAFGTPLMHFLKLSADQSPAAELRQGTYQFGATHTKFNSFI